MSKVPNWILPLILGMGITALFWWQSTVGDTVQGGWTAGPGMEQVFEGEDLEDAGLVPAAGERKGENRSGLEVDSPVENFGARRSSLGRGPLLVPENAGRLQVVLLDAATRSPLPGIPVVAYLESPPNGRPTPTRRTKGSRGRLDLTPLSNLRGGVEFDLPPGQAIRLSVRPSSSEHQPTIERIDPLEPYEMRTLEIMVRGVAYTEFHGLVRDRETGKEIDGAAVRVHSMDTLRTKPMEALAEHLLTTRSDAQGCFEIDASEQGSFAWLQAPGYGPTLIALDAAHQSRTNPREAYLTSAAFLAIALRDGHGKPLEGLQVRLRISSSSLTQTETEGLEGQTLFWTLPTDRYGRVEFESLPADAPIAIEVRSSGPGVIVPPPMQILNPGETRQVQWVIGGGTRLSGKLTLGDGVEDAPLGGQELWLLPASKAGSKLATSGDQGRALHKTHTDDGGNFVFSGVPSGAWWITPAAKGTRTRFAPIARHFEVPKDLPNLNVSIEVFPALWVSGRIEPINGQNPGRQRLWVRSTTTPGTLNQYTDDKGHFRIGPLPPGPLEIAVYPAKGHPGSAPQVCTAGAKDVRLTLRLAARIRALLSTADGSPNPSIERILLTHPDGQVTQEHRLSIDDLAPGVYALSVLATDGRTAWAQHIEARAGRAPGEAILELSESAAITLTGPGNYSIWTEGACVAQGHLKEGESLAEPLPIGPMRLMIEGQDKPAKVWGSKKSAPVRFGLQ